MYALGTFQVTVDDFVLMEVVHPRGDLYGPVNGQSRRQFILVVT